MSGWGAAASAVSTLAGDVISAQSNQNMNLANRTFNAQQAALNREFQTQQIAQQEQFQEDMSNTQIQRRVSDIEKAGLNPLLAVGQLGGASSPMGAAAGGAQAQAPPMTAPGSAFQNLGAATTSAVSNFNQALLQQAQAKKTISETPTPQYLTVTSNPDGTQNVEVNGNAGHELGDQELKNLQATVNQANADIGNKQSQTNLNDVTAMVQTLNYETQVQLMASLIKAQNAQNNLDATTATSGQKVMGANVAGTNLGTWIEALRLAIGASKGH